MILDIIKQVKQFERKKPKKASQGHHLHYFTAEESSDRIFITRKEEIPAILSPGNN